MDDRRHGAGDRDFGARRGRISVVSLAVGRSAMKERAINWLGRLTKPGSPPQDMVEGYQLIAIAALSGTVLAVLWGCL